MDRPKKEPEGNTDDEVQICEHINVVEIWWIVVVTGWLGRNNKFLFHKKLLRLRSSYIHYSALERRMCYTACSFSIELEFFIDMYDKLKRWKEMYQGDGLRQNNQHLQNHSRLLATSANSWEWLRKQTFYMLIQLRFSD